MTDLPTYTPSEVLAATFIIRNLLGANGDLWRYILDKTTEQESLTIEMDIAKRSARLAAVDTTLDSLKITKLTIAMLKADEWNAAVKIDQYTLALTQYTLAVATSK